LNHARSGLPYQTHPDLGKPALETLACPKISADARKVLAWIAFPRQAYTRAGY